MSNPSLDPLEEIINSVIGLYSRKDLAHNLAHAFRVRSWARKLAIEEGADVVVVELAALLHDIGRSGTIERTHAESSAQLAAGILMKFNYPEEVIYKVKEAIISHSREVAEPKTPEAKILYDADKLDFVGPIGLARLFALAGVEGWTFIGEDSARSFYQDTINNYGKYIYTTTARRYFTEYYSFMENFWVAFDKQIALMNENIDRN